MTHRALGLTLVLPALAACGCGAGGGAPAAGEAANAAWAFEREFNQGAPVSLVLRLDRVEATLADTITLEQDLRVEEGFEADFPEYLPEDFEGFSVVEISREAPPGPGAAPGEKAGAAAGGAAAGGPAAEASSGGRPAVRSRKKRLTLEPDRTGALAIAPLAVYFHAAGKEGETQESSFLTEEVPVTVSGVEDLEKLALAPLRGIYEAPPDASGFPLGAALAGAAGLALAAGAAAYLLLRRRERKAPPPVPPHEVAYESLRRLVALNLLEKGHVELFFVHLSGILRQYIESRFGVHAPRRTTEEFLEEAARDLRLVVHRARLAQFLDLSDQVKFARFQPDEASIQSAFDVCKRFIAETTPAEAPP
ncbi:MAG: hypothetical protein HY721_05095 [Planctomycetes bacterium]|nr:hypothetical protein [Planctomycetota bacterium]